MGSRRVAADKRAARLGVLALVGMMLFGLVGARIWFLQTVEQESLQAQVDTTKLRTVPLLPERGRIFDAEGRILADNDRVLTVAVDWGVIRNRDNRTEIFPSTVRVGRRARRGDGGPVRESGVQPVPADAGRRGHRRTHGDRHRGARGGPARRRDPRAVRRVYPYAPIASHVIGYLGRITAETKDFYQSKGYYLNERVGQFGIELSMEEELHGKWGYVTYEVDNASRIVREVRRVPPINGNDVQLTIDLDQQQFAEQALETKLRLRQQQVAINPRDPETNFEELVFPDYPREVPYKAPAGSVVVQNYQNGQIIALASYPTFDNRWFEADLSGGKFDEIFPSVDANGDPIDPDESILVNRAIQGRYNLGSTFKPFVAFAALDTGLMGIDDYYRDEGTYRMESVDEDECDDGLVRCVYRNATCSGTGRPCVYGSVDVETALAVSSDAFFYRIGELIMTQNDYQPVLQDEVRKFGFGSDPGIQLPYAFDGTVPDAELKALYGELGVISEVEASNYFTGDNVQMSIGQGLLSASPLQLTMGYSTIANKGYLMKPEIIKAVYQPGVPDSAVQGYVDLTQATLASEPNVAGEVVRQLPLALEAWEEIDRGLTRVIYGKGTTSDYYHSTTGENLFYYYPDDAIPLAGKTGTVQGAGNYPWNDSSAFAAYSRDPARPYTVTAYLEKAGYGSQAAAPVVKCMFLQMSGITQADPVRLSDALDTTATVPAQPRQLADTSCYEGRFSNVRTVE
jgi:penicillin-binding protein 2